MNLKGTGNVVSVELHNGRPSSSDVYLDFQSLTFGTAVPEKEIKNISLNIGSDETQRNITWMASSDKEAYVQVATKSEGWVEGNEFPADAVSYNRTTITNVTVTRNSFTVDTYYTDSDELQKMDSFTIYRTENPTIRVQQTETGKITIQVGKAFNPMTGVSAQDYEGNDITELVHVTVYNADTGEQVQYVDTSKTGNYRIVYDVADTYGKTASAEQLVEVVKNTGENPGQNPDETPSENPDENPSENPGQISGKGSGNGQTDNNGKGSGLATAGTSQSTKTTTVKTGDTLPQVWDKN